MSYGRDMKFSIKSNKKVGKSSALECETTNPKMLSQDYKFTGFFDKIGRQYRKWESSRASTLHVEGYQEAAAEIAIVTATGIWWEIILYFKTAFSNCLFVYVLFKIL